ncbi:hypothetical protein JMUB7535_26650 [Staphylococcus aureus]
MNINIEYLNGNKTIGLFFLRSEAFFQAEDGIRDLRMSRGLGDVYKRQNQITIFDIV